MHQKLLNKGLYSDVGLRNICSEVKTNTGNVGKSCYSWLCQCPAVFLFCLCRLFLYLLILNLMPVKLGTGSPFLKKKKKLNTQQRVLCYNRTVVKALMAYVTSALFCLQRSSII